MEATVASAIDGQRRRAIAVILAVKDEHVDPHIPDDVAVLLRKAVLDAVNDFWRNTIQILSAAEEGLTVNELVIDRLAERDTSYGRAAHG